MPRLSTMVPSTLAFLHSGGMVIKLESLIDGKNLSGVKQRTMRMNPVELDTL